MRTQALILLIPFLVFLTETASFIPGMDDACAIVAVEKSDCSKPEKKGQCGTKTACAKPMKQDECSKKENGRENADNKCDNNHDCTTCPVCYTFIYQPQYEWVPRHFVYSKNYNLLTASYTSVYINSVWKPPNGHTDLLQTTHI